MTRTTDPTDPIDQGRRPHRWPFALLALVLLAGACSADASGTRGSRGEDPCALLTAEEAAQATSRDIVEAERRDDPNGDDGCSYVDATGAWVGALKVTDPERAAQRVAQRSSRPVEGVGEGGALTDDGYVGYVRVGSVAYLWASGGKGVFTTDQVTDLLRATVR